MTQDIKCFKYDIIILKKERIFQFNSEFTGLCMRRSCSKFPEVGEFF